MYFTFWLKLICKFTLASWLKTYVINDIDIGSFCTTLNFIKCLIILFYTSICIFEYKSAAKLNYTCQILKGLKHFIKKCP